LPSCTTSERDARKWVQDVKQELIKNGEQVRFKYKNLPKHLKSKPMFRKAGELYLIEIVEKDKWNVATWGIN